MPDLDLTLSDDLLLLPSYGTGTPGPGEGLPDVAVQITDPRAFPPGIESRIVFNGLVLNNRSTVDKYRVTRIEGLADADVRDTREPNPSNHGETALDSLYGGRTLTLTGRVEAFTLNKLRAMQQALRSAFVDLTTEKPLIFRTGDTSRDGYLMCKKYQSIAWGEEQQGYNHFRDFMIPLRASNPRWFGYLGQTLGTVFPDAPAAQTAVRVGTSPGALEAFNVGNFLSPPEIILAGPMTNPSVTNLRTGQSFSIVDTIAAGDAYKLDVFKRQLYSLVDGTNKFKTLTIASDLWEIQPGENIITFSADLAGDDASVNVLYRSAWM